MNKVSLRQEAGVELVRSASKNKLDPHGRFVVQHVRNGETIGEYSFPNGITNEGKNKLLNVMFHGTTPITDYYLGLIDITNYGSLGAADTYDDINQAADLWKEFTAYTDNANGSSSTTRPVWGEGAASGQSITNSSAAIFDITSAGTVKGVFLVGGDASLKNDHTAGPILWATALFTSGDVTVANGDQLKVTYTVSA